MAALTYGLLHAGSFSFETAATAATEPRTLAGPQPALRTPEPESPPPQAAAEPSATEPEPSAPPPPADLQAPTAGESSEAATAAVEPAIDARAASAAPAKAARTRAAEAPVPSSAESTAMLSFPEFTDSSRPPARTRAADGPRIESLFEPAEAPPARRREETPPPAESPREPTSAVSSCEAAVARNNEELRIGAAQGPADVSRESYAAILQDGRYLSRCSVPDRTVFEICAAVKGGRAVGVTVVSSPPNAALNACVRGAVARLRFPESPRLDVTHTRFDAVGR